MSATKQIGIAIIAHGDLAECFLKAASLVYQQPIKHVSTLAIQNTLSLEQVRSRCYNVINKLASKNSNVIVLCDTFGATASTIICKQIAEKANVMCVFGLNLSMLLDCIVYRDNCTLQQLAEKICVTGKEAIFVNEANDDCPKE